MPPRKVQDTLKPTDLISRLIAKGSVVDARLTSATLQRNHTPGEPQLGAGTTPLMRAARNGDYAAMKILLAAGADPTLKQPRGTTALMMASGSGAGWACSRKTTALRPTSVRPLNCSSSATWTSTRRPTMASRRFIWRRRAASIRWCGTGQGRCEPRREGQEGPNTSRHGDGRRWSRPRRRTATGLRSHGKVTQGTGCTLNVDSELRVIILATVIAIAMRRAASSRRLRLRNEPTRSRKVKFRSERRSRRSRSAEPSSRRRRRGAIRTSPATTTTATRAASRSSDRTNTRGVPSTPSRRPSSRRWSQQRQQQTIERTPGLSEFPGATSPMHWFENYYAVNSRPWLVTDPADGKVPAQTAEARQRQAARQAARKGRGPADSWEDRSLYDRCITRGIPGSMMPAIYGNSYHIHQSPGFVTITYEMVHDTRVIPLDSRPHVAGHFVSTSATAAATGKATRSSSRRRTSPTRRRTAARATS